MYRRIEISGLGGTLPERVGSFVVGIPRKMIEDLWNKNPSHSDDAIFRTLVSASEYHKMGDWLKILANTSTVDRQFPFTGTAETLGKPTFENAWCRGAQRVGAETWIRQ